MSGDVHTLTGAYVANALPSDERRFFDRHLQACEACSQEVGQLTEAAGVLAAIEAVHPPASMRGLVIDRIAATPQDPPVVPPRQARRRISGPGMFSQRILMPVAAVLALMAVVTGATALSLNARVGELELAAEQMTAVMNADDAQFVQMDGPGGSRVRVVMSPQLDSAVFMVSGMEPAPHEHTYELWLIGNAQPSPAGIFDVDRDGAATYLVSGDMSDVQAIGVTIEPDGGSPVPSGDPIMIVPLRS